MFDCPPQDVVALQVAAWEQRDAEAFAMTYAPDAVIITGGGEDENIVGRDAIRDHYANTFIEMPAWLEMTVAERIVSGEYVIDQEVFLGDQISGDVVVIYRVVNCLITEVSFLPYVDHTATAEAVRDVE